MRFTIRPARPEDAPVLQSIERLAGERFREVGLDAVADDEPMSIETLVSYAGDGRSWVAIGEDGAPCGYLLVDDVDGAAHVEQVSVVPAWQGQGVGRALIDRAEQWAAATGRAAVTLSTFADVPWNRPLYEHLGFRVLSEDGIGPGLAQVRDHEAAMGFDPAARVMMRRDIARGLREPPLR